MTDSSGRAVRYLLFRGLAELAMLPVHVAVFLVRRRAIRREIREFLERQR